MAAVGIAAILDPCVGSIRGARSRRSQEHPPLVRVDPAAELSK